MESRKSQNDAGLNAISCYSKTLLLQVANWMCIFPRLPSVAYLVKQRLLFSSARFFIRKWFIRKQNSAAQIVRRVQYWISQTSEMLTTL